MVRVPPRRISARQRHVGSTACSTAITHPRRDPGGRGAWSRRTGGVQAAQPRLQTPVGPVTPRYACCAEPIVFWWSASLESVRTLSA
jgi:hypothetical protein